MSPSTAHRRQWAAYPFCHGGACDSCLWLGGTQGFTGIVAVGCSASFSVTFLRRTMPLECLSIPHKCARVQFCQRICVIDLTVTATTTGHRWIQGPGPDYYYAIGQLGMALHKSLFAIPLCRALMTMDAIITGLEG